MVFSVDMLHTLGVAPQLCLVSRTFRRRSPQITSLATVLERGYTKRRLPSRWFQLWKWRCIFTTSFIHSHIHQFQFRISPLCWYESGWPKWELHFVQAHTKKPYTQEKLPKWHRFVLSRNSWHLNFFGKPVEFVLQIPNNTFANSLQRCRNLLRTNISFWPTFRCREATQIVKIVVNLRKNVKHL